MKILIIGKGGREHALAWAIKKSQYAEEIYAAPGNAGISEIAEIVNISEKDIRSLASFAEKKNIDLTIVGPELPLSMGIVDYFKRRNLRIFGPTIEASKIESSKVFAKNFMRKYNIPTASYKVFDNAEDAILFLEKREFPLVIKTDGLAGGKGTIIAHNLDEAKDAIVHVMIEQHFGKAGKRVVIEEFLTGMELSMMTLTDGKTIIPLISAMDYKQIYDKGVGSNTGGMGAIAPHPMITDEIKDFAFNHILKPTIQGLQLEKTPFTGILYAGLMITETGIKCLEFNCRFGDPETQAILPLLRSDFVEMLLYATETKLDEYEPSWFKKHSICVVLASGGYPKRYKKGYEIKGLKDVDDDALIFHAGTTVKKSNIITNGGRVLGISASADTLDKARKMAYRNVNKISFTKAYNRKDIGLI